MSQPENKPKTAGKGSPVLPDARPGFFKRAISRLFRNNTKNNENRLPLEEIKVDNGTAKKLRERGKSLGLPDTEQQSKTPKPRSSSIGKATVEAAQVSNVNDQNPNNSLIDFTPLPPSAWSEDPKNESMPDEYSSARLSTSVGGYFESSGSTGQPDTPASGSRGSVSGGGQSISNFLFPHQHLPELVEPSQTHSSVPSSRRNSESATGSRISQPETPGSASRKRGYSFSGIKSSEFVYAEEPPIAHVRRGENRAPIIALAAAAKFFPPLKKPENKEKIRVNIQQSLERLRESQRKQAEREQKRAERIKENARIQELKRLDEARKNAAQEKMKACNQIEEIKKLNPNLIAAAEKQLEIIVGQFVNSSLFMMMFHPVPPEVNTNAQFLDDYITALADRLLVLALHRFKLLAEPNLSLLAGMDIDIEGDLHPSVIQFSKDHQPQINKKLQNAVAKETAESKDDNDVRIVQIPKAVVSNQIDDAIKRCVNYLANNNILSTIKPEVKELLAKKVTAYIEIWLPYMDAENQAARAAEKTAESLAAAPPRAVF